MLRATLNIQDIPVPSFVNERPQEEWTPEEVKIYQIYEQKVKELNEERDKLRKVIHYSINLRLLIFTKIMFINE